MGGFGIESFRFVTALFSALWLIYLWRFWNRNDWPARWTLVIVALSPAFFFFGRSAIHETPFLFFMTLTLGGFYELFYKERAKAWLPIIWGTAGVITLKETWVLMAVALLLSGLFLFITSPQFRIALKNWRWFGRTWPREALVHLVLAILVVVLLFTGFGARSQGLVDMVMTYLPWMKTGVHGSGHNKSVWYWLNLLWMYEKPLLFLFIGGVSTAVLFWRYLSLTTKWIFLGAVLQVLIYSLIPYKTPWCIIAVFGPLIFAMGCVRGDMRAIGFANPVQVLCGVLAVLFLFFQINDFKQLNFVNPTDHDHEYVYVQTDTRLKKLVDSLIEAAEAQPALYKQKIQFGGTEPWPMVWWLGRFSNQEQRPVSKGVDKEPLLLIVDQQDEQTAFNALNVEDYQIFRFPIREGRAPSIFLLRKGSLKSEVKL